MEYLIVFLKGVVSLSIINVWLFRVNRATPWRGGDAKSLVQEFHAYGLPTAFVYIIGILKVGLALLLLASIMWKEFALYAAGGIGVLMVAAIIMHIKIGDPLKKSLPAFFFLVLSAAIYIYHSGLW